MHSSHTSFMSICFPLQNMFPFSVRNIFIPCHRFAYIITTHTQYIYPVGYDVLSLDLISQDFRAHHPCETLSSIAPPVALPLTPATAFASVVLHSAKLCKAVSD